VVTESTTVTAPLVLITYDISIPAAATAADGYLTQADWNTFNGKAAASHAMSTHSDEDTYNILTSGTLGAGVATLATGSTIGNLTLENGSITDSSNAIDFGNEALSTTGTLTIGTTLTLTGAGVIKNSADDQQTIIYSSNTVDKGAKMAFCGAEHATYPGDLYLDYGDSTSALASSKFYVRYLSSTSPLGSVIVADSSGRVGVGGTPSANLHLVGNSANVVTLKITNDEIGGNDYMDIMLGGGTAYGIAAWQDAGIIEAVPGSLVLGSFGGAMKFYAGTGRVTQMTLDTSGNFGIGQTTFGTNAAKVLAMGNATAPTSSPANCFQMYSADQAAGNACLHTRTEGGAVVKIYQQAHIADAPGDTAANNATTINAILVALENAGLLATS